MHDVAARECTPWMHVDARGCIEHSELSANDACTLLGRPWNAGFGRHTRTVAEALPGPRSIVPVLLTGNTGRFKHMGLCRHHHFRA